MAISYFSQAENAGLFIGLAADTKPSAPANGLIFIETDTALIYTAVAGSWVMKTTGANLSLSDITTNNATTSAHGFLPKLSGNAAQVLKGDGTFGTVGGTGDVVGPAVSVASQIALFDGITGKLVKADTTTGIVKATAGVISAAVGDTDYALPATVALKSPLANPTFTGTVAGITAAMVGAQPVDSDLTTIAGLTATTDNFMVANASAWASRTPAQAKTALAIANTDVSGLGTLSTQSGTFSGTSSGTNTGDQTAIANATLANMATKTYKGRTTAGTGSPEDVAVATLKTDLVLVKGDVGLGSADNTSDASKPVSTATQTALDLKSPLASPTFTGTVTLPAQTVTLAMQANMATSSLVYRKTAGSGAPEINTLATVKTDLALVKADVGLGSVDNTSDAGKPVSTAQQTALNLKADLASPTFTGTPTLPTGTVATTQAAADSTTKVATTAFVTTANNLKANLASPTFTGTPTLPTGTIATTQAAGNNTTAVATTAFVTAINDNTTYRTILEAAGSHIAAKVAGTYAIGYGDPLAVSGTGTLYPLAVIQIASADYPTVNGITTKLRIRAQLYVNDVAPTGNFTFGLYPITRPATSGGAGLNIYTLGTVVSGSNGATFTAPAADLLGSAVGSDFTIPADGPYVIGVVTTATVATSSHLHLNAQLQIRNA